MIWTCSSAQWRGPQQYLLDSIQQTHLLVTPVSASLLTWRPSGQGVQGRPVHPVWCGSGLCPAWWSWAAQRRWPSRRPVPQRCSSVSVRENSVREGWGEHGWGEGFLTATKKQQQQSQDRLVPLYNPPSSPTTRHRGLKLVRRSTALCKTGCWFSPAILH